MVALVATAVRPFFGLYIALMPHVSFMRRSTSGALENFKLQSSQQNAYLDVYLGHMNTLKHIREKCEGAFHLMMADIYKQAE
jgi:hypothetical protein